MEVEFRDRDGSWDLRPSVYEVRANDETELNRIMQRLYTEHAASFLRDPPKSIPPLNMDTDRSVVSTLGRTFFRLANRCHREIVLQSESDLRNLVRSLQQQLAVRRLNVVTVQEMLDYANARLEEADDEWVSFVRNSEKGSKWLAHVNRHRKRTGKPPLPSVM